MNVQRAICTNDGQCKLQARPPRLIVLEPEADLVYEEGTRRIRVTGEVTSAASSVQIEVRSHTLGDCAGGPDRSVSVENPTNGEFVSIPFVVDGIEVDTGVTQLTISASNQGSAVQHTQVNVEVPCPGCAEISIAGPSPNSGAPGLALPLLDGFITPVPAGAIWRVHGSQGDVFDGALAVTGGGSFAVERLPLFTGNNRVEVVVSGVGRGLGESRCSTTVQSSSALEHGLRAVLNWDGGSSDLDIHLIGPGAFFGDPLGTLAARSPSPTFGGKVVDDFDGLGPEVLTLSRPLDGVYGLVVEAVTDGSDSGSNAGLYVLGEGRLLRAGPLGPKNLSARRGDLWVVATLTVQNGQIQMQIIDEIVPVSAPPTQPPSAWPLLY